MIYRFIKNSSRLLSERRINQGGILLSSEQIIFELFSRSIRPIIFCSIEFLMRVNSVFYACFVSSYYALLTGNKNSLTKITK